MDFNEVIEGRRSIRKFKDKPVENELVEKIILSGIWAPSAGNIQSWEVIIVKNEDNKSKISNAAYMRDFISKAPIILVICANMERSAEVYGERGYDLYSIQDAAAASQNMLLTAHDLSLAGCWIGSFDENAVKNILNIPNGVRPVALIPLGYPDEKPYPPTRRSLDEVTHEETY
ncbi:MAG: nitroreductase family protein [Methanomicrobiales archaeon]